MKKKRIDDKIGVPKGEIRLAKCCNPLPEDEIVASRTTKRKIMVHRKDCKNVANIPKGTIVQIPWGRKEGSTYEASIHILANDRAALLVDLLSALTGEKAEIVKTEAKSRPGGKVICKFKLKIQDYAHLQKIMGSLEDIESVHLVQRV